MKNDLFYQIALTLIPHIGAVQARLLIEKYGDAKTIFNASHTTLENTEGIGSFRAKCIRGFKGNGAVEEEMAFIEKYNIKPLFITNPDYPKRLLNCYDPPTMLYYKGTANLNSTRAIAIIGTRVPSEYGKEITEKLITDLSDSGALIISGLAYGIDATAHRMALKCRLPTVGVMAHGLHTIYPSQHTAMAKEMMAEGGLITEFGNHVKPAKHNFPQRNRVVAGMTDATIVVETGIKGGSMITAELANDYNRDVFVFPGRNCDVKSAGCNLLIRNNKAVLLTDTAQFIKAMGWDERGVHDAGDRQKQQQLFNDLSEDEKRIVAVIIEQQPIHIDELSAKSNLPRSSIASALLGLELKNCISILPGKMYKLL